MRSIFVAAMLVAFGVAHAGVLWGKASSGADLATVKAAYPQGAIIEPHDRNRLKTGAVQRFELGDVEVNGDKFKAQFYFQGDALEQVTLRFTGDMSAAACDSKYSSLHSALSGKYGAPVAVDGAMPSRRIAESTFSSGILKVSTFAMASPEKCSLSIFYTDKSGGTASNL